MTKFFLPIQNPLIVLSAVYSHIWINHGESNTSLHSWKRKNWVNIDSVNGAKASAIAYGLVETALANHINVYDYFEYLFSKMPDHLDDSDRSFITGLLPWSPEVIKRCKRQSK